MNLNQQAWKNMFLSAAQLLKEQSPYLSEIDSKFGDGDHGVTMNKIAIAIETAVEHWQSESLQCFLDTLGNRIMGVNGGSAGPLYGTMIGGLSVPLQEETEIDGTTLKKMLQGMLDELSDISNAKVGDKTMMDALIPAVKAAQDSSDNPTEILTAAANAAIQGAKDSEQYIAKFGRARSYKEQTIGTPDAGAVSTSYFFKGLADAIQS